MRKSRQATKLRATIVEAQKSFDSVFLVIDLGNLGGKLKRILEEKNKQAAKKIRTPDIVVVDAIRSLPQTLIVSFECNKHFGPFAGASW